MIDKQYKIAKIWLTVLTCEVIIEIILTSLLPIANGYVFNQVGAKTALIGLGIFLYTSTRIGFDICQSFKQYIIIHLATAKRYIKTIELGVGENTKAWEKGADNTEQRIQEDIKIFFTNNISAMTEYTISFGILIVLLIDNYKETFLVLTALGYALVSLLLAWIFNPSMKKAERMVQQTEATYRKNLIIHRQLYGFAEVLQANKRSACLRLRFSLFTKIQSGLLLAIPYLILMPDYLAGHLQLGGLMKNAGIFQLIVVNADILINMFPVLTAGNASKERVKEIE